MWKNKKSATVKQVIVRMPDRMINTYRFNEFFQRKTMLENILSTS